MESQLFALLVAFVILFGLLILGVAHSTTRSDSPFDPILDFFSLEPTSPWEHELINPAGPRCPWGGCEVMVFTLDRVHQLLSTDARSLRWVTPTWVLA